MGKPMLSTYLDPLAPSVRFSLPMKRSQLHVPGSSPPAGACCGAGEDAPHRTPSPIPSLQRTPSAPSSPHPHSTLPLALPVASHVITIPGGPPQRVTSAGRLPARAAGAATNGRLPSPSATADRHHRHRRQPFLSLLRCRGLLCLLFSCHRRRLPLPLLPLP